MFAVCLPIEALVGTGALIAVALTGESYVEEFHSVAVRDLEREQIVGPPSGETVARRLGRAEFSSLRRYSFFK